MKTIGHQQIIEYFKKAQEGECLSHAYIFVGPEAVGKFHVALKLSEEILCLGASSNSLFAQSTDVQEKPCGQCESCQSLKKGMHPDFSVVRVLEEKHEISIEQIKDVLTGVYLTPAMGKRKIVIIDDAHFLNVSASNAFLKTLEEPPEASLIFLITNRPDRLPQTILSRCQMFEFSKSRNIMPADANARMWQMSRGLPGLFFSWQEDESKYADWQEEIDKFMMLCAAQRGERLKMISTWFKKDAVFADVKAEWKLRLDLWQFLLRDAIMVQLGQDNLAIHPQKVSIQSDDVNKLRLLIDCLSELSRQIDQNIKIRAQVESFALIL